MVRITNTKFRNSTSNAKNGGALNIWSGNSDGQGINGQPTTDSWVDLTGCTFENCYALNGTGTNGNGGAMRSTARYNTITDCSFINNIGNNGGAINIYNSKAVNTIISGCSFNGCSARDKGGAIWCRSKTLTIDAINHETSAATPNNTSIRSCMAPNEGGAIYHVNVDSNSNPVNLASGSSFTMVDATIDTCYSNTKGGGGVYTNALTVSLTDSTVENCYTAGTAQNGGGLYLANSSETTFSGATIRNNTATGMGGGVFHAAKGTFKVTGSTISGNIAQGEGDQDGNGNDLHNSGGGIYTTNKKLILKDSTVSDNQAYGHGGGICQNYNGNDGMMELDGATVTGNIAGHMDGSDSVGKGGGIYTLTNLTLRGFESVTSSEGQQTTTVNSETKITGNRLRTEEAEDAAGLYLRDGVDVHLKLSGDAYNNAVETDMTKRARITITGNLTVDGKPSNLRLPDKDQYENDNKVKVYCGVDGEIRVVKAKKKLTQFGDAQTVSSDSLTDPAGFTDEYKVFWAEDDSLYGIVDRQDTNHKKIIWGGDPICKITDGNGRLLYIDSQHVRPAVFDRLDALTTNHTTDTTTTSAFSTLRTLDTAGTSLYYADGTPYTGSVYQVKMLIEEYESEYYMEVTGGSGRTVTLTTAGSKDSLYPYRGREGTSCTITRSAQMNTGHAMVTAKANFTLSNIKLDGNMANVTATDHTRIIKAECARADAIAVTLGQKAVIQNAETTGNGGGVYLNKDAQLSVSGGSIRNCKAANGGAVYIDGTNGTMNMSVGTITKCEATGNGGGVYFNKGVENQDTNGNTIGVMRISGGTISRCTAANGGGVYLNTGARHLYMSGGSIAQNSVTGIGGGIAVGSNEARIYFSGAPYVYQNTSTNSAVEAGPAPANDPFYMVYAKANNVYMDQDFATGDTNPGTVIVSRGLSRGASVGVYVPGDEYASGLYGDHGAELDPFATFEDNAIGGMNFFVNDRNGMKGGKLDDQNTSLDKKIYWRKIYSLSITKTVLSDDPTDQNSSRYYQFQVEMTGYYEENNQRTYAEHFSGVYGNVNFTNGVGYFAITNGETKVIDLLPLGFGYRVTELLNTDQSSHFTTTTENDKGIVAKSYDASNHPYAEGTMDTPTKFNYPVTFYNLHAVCKIVGITTDTITGEEWRELLYVYDSDTSKYIPAVYSSLVTAFSRVNTGESRTWYYKDASGTMATFIPDEYSVEMLVPEYNLEGPAALQNGRKATLTTAARDADDGFPYVGGSTVAEIDRAYQGDSMITVDTNANLTLGRITLDGKGSTYTVSNNNGAGDMVLVKNTGSLTVGTGVTLQNAKTSNRAAAVYLEQGGKMYISGAPVFTDNVNTTGSWLNQNNQTSTVKKNGDDASYYLDNGSLRIPMDIYIAGYKDATATSLVVTGNITSQPGSIAIWAQQKPHYVQNQQFAVIQDGVDASDPDFIEGLMAFRNAYPDWQSENPLVTEHGKPLYLYGIPRNGDVYWSGSMDLIVTKVVPFDFTGSDRDTDEFTFEVSGLRTGFQYDFAIYNPDGTAKTGNEYSGKWTVTAQEDGKKTFTLRNGEKIIVSIPRGIVVQVKETTEATYPQYDTEYSITGNTIPNGSIQGTGYQTPAKTSNNEDVIDMSADTTVTFTNTRKTQTVTVTKTLDDRRASSAIDFTFTAKLEYTQSGGSTVNVTGYTLWQDSQNESNKLVTGDGENGTVAGVASFTLSPSDSNSWVDSIVLTVPYGTKLTVTEDTTQVIENPKTVAEVYTTTYLLDSNTSAVPDDSYSFPSVTDNHTLAFTNKRKGADLTVIKTVAGDFADQSQAFTFTVDGLPNDGVIYTYTKYSTSDNGSTWTQLGTGATGTLSYSAKTFQLTHNQKVIIEGLPLDTQLTLTEDHGYYTMTVPATNPAPTNMTHYSISDSAGTVNGASFQLSDDAGLSVTNTLNAPSPTGVRFRSLPFVIMLAVGMMLPVVMPRRRRRRDEE